MPFAVYSSKNPSCGCQQRALKSTRRNDSPNYRLVEQLQPTDVKAVYAKFRVECRACNASFVVSNAQLLSPKKSRVGCLLCVKAKLAAKSRVFHDHAEDRTLSEQVPGDPPSQR